MDWRSLLDARPVVVVLAGSNGAGKTTFFHAHLADAGLRFVNADDLAAEMGIGAYEAADLAAALRASLIDQRESFVFETVLSDPIGAKVAELADASRRGLHVVMLFIRIDSPATSKQRVAMRAMQGGHDVPDEKLEARFARTLANLERAIAMLPVVVIFDNTDLARPFRLEAVYQAGKRLT
ncbi:MAG: zeta toxin family protein [Planctomycetia bacterium]